MKTFRTLSDLDYRSADGPSSAYARPENELDYRGFKAVREPPYFVWRIVEAPEGQATPHDLTGRFTAIKLIKTTIDNYLDRQNANDNSNPHNG